jgi:glycosyltransferase involved in cell wall biosynthesis
MSLAASIICVVVPARNEARWIGEVVRTIPSWVDHIVVVDDASEDATREIASAQRDDRVDIVRHRSRRGVGGAIVSGYRRATDLGADVVAVMAGDAQMDPHDLEGVIRPVLDGHAHYVKGNRLRHGSARAMPLARALGSAVFGALTSLATAVRVGDSQCGYTAISREALERLDLAALWRGYGYPNDVLGAVARAGLAIEEVPVRPVYRGAASGLRPYHAAVIVFLLGRVVWRRATA